jgi:hypothetical protein
VDNGELRDDGRRPPVSGTAETCPVEGDASPAPDIWDRRIDRRRRLPCDIEVELRATWGGSTTPPLVGQAEDLGMSGMGVLVAREIDPVLHNAFWVARFALPDPAGRPDRLSLKCVLIYGLPSQGNFRYGFQFLGIGAPAQAESRRVLRQFLLSDLREQWDGPARS